MKKKKVLRAQQPKQIPGIVVFAPIGEEKSGALTAQGKAHAKTQGLIIDDILGDCTRVIALYNVNHEPSSTAAAIMTKGLVNVELIGLNCRDFSLPGDFVRLNVMNRIEEYESQADGLLVIGARYVSYTMTKCYAEAKNFPPVAMEQAKPDEVYQVNTHDKACYISHTKHHGVLS